MKTLLLTLAAVLALAACNSSKHVSLSDVGYRQLDNYFYKESGSLAEEYGYLVITDEAGFNASFNPAKTMNNVIVQPDFSGQAVVAVVARPVSILRNLVIDRVAIGDKDMNVYYHVEDKGPITYSMAPVVLGTVPRSQRVSQVNFYLDNKLAKTISVSMQ